MKIFALLLLLLFLCIGNAQELGARNLMLNPFIYQTPTGFLTKTLYGVEANRGFGSTGQEHYWNLKFNAFIEFYNWGFHKLYLVGSNELTANPYSDIKFNPRTSNWNERILLLVQHDALVTEWGVTHQCKHDIDNQEPIYALDSTGVTRGNRVLILTSLHGGVITPQEKLFSKITYSAALHYHYYLLAYDYNEPVVNRNTDWSTLSHTLRAAIKVHYRVTPDTRIYNRSWVMGHGFEGLKEWAFANRTEFGLSLVGHRGSLDIYSSFEHMVDDGVNPWSQHSDVFSLGVRIRDASL